MTQTHVHTQAHTQTIDLAALAAAVAKILAGTPAAPAAPVGAPAETSEKPAAAAEKPAAAAVPQGRFLPEELKEYKNMPIVHPCPIARVTAYTPAGGFTAVSEKLAAKILAWAERRGLLANTPKPTPEAKAKAAKTAENRAKITPARAADTMAPTEAPSPSVASAEVCGVVRKPARIVKKGLTKAELLKLIRIEVGRTLVRGYPTAQLEAAMRGRFGHAKRDSVDTLEALLAWYRAGDY